MTKVSVLNNNAQADARKIASDNSFFGKLGAVLSNILTFIPFYNPTVKDKKGPKIAPKQVSPMIPRLVKVPVKEAGTPETKKLLF